ncbi:MAG: hypothetical protein AAFU77_11835 [Myxococcota bacterium]
MATGCSTSDAAPAPAEESQLACVDDTPFAALLGGETAHDPFVLQGGNIATQQRDEAILRRSLRNQVLEDLWRSEKVGMLSEVKAMWIDGGWAEIVEEFERDRPIPKKLLQDKSFWQTPEERETAPSGQ